MKLLSFTGVAALVAVVVVLSPGAVEAKPQGLLSFKDVLAYSLFSAAKTPKGNLGDIWSDCSKTWIVTSAWILILPSLAHADLDTPHAAQLPLPLPLPLHPPQVSLHCTEGARSLVQHIIHEL